MYLQIDPTTHAIPILVQWGVAGLLLAVLGYVVWKGAKFFKEELIKKDVEIERLRVINKELTEQMLTQVETYAKTLLEHEKDNLTSLNDITNALNQVIVLVQELKAQS